MDTPKQFFTPEQKKHIVLINIITVVIVLGVIGLSVYANQSKVFEYFAGQYLRDITTATNGPDTPNSPGLLSQEALVIEAVRKADPAVVAIVATKDVPIFEQFFVDPFGGLNDPFGSPFQFQIPQLRERGTESRQVGAGSGFIVSRDGIAITNRHVVADDKAEYTAFTSDGEQHDVEVLAKDPLLDLAVIQIEGGSFASLQLGNSDDLQIGQSVISIGNALGEFRNSVSVGIISGLSRSIVAGDNLGGTEVLDEVIQTDAAINPGNSGGPLLDLRGRVIGVNVATATTGDNISFAIPVNVVKGIVDSVEATGRIIRPFVGVRYVMINDRIAENNKLDVDYGALVVRGETREDLAVVPGSPADIAGITENDIILEVDGVKLENGKTLASVIRGKQVGDVVLLRILSKGEEKTVEVTLEEAPE